MNLKQYVPAIFLVAFAFAMGWYVGTVPDSGNSFHENYRNPAAIHSDYDFFELVGNELTYKTKLRLYDDIEVSLKDGQYGVSLGNFVVKGEGGQREFACGFYDEVEIVFRAEGMAESGHIPELTVTGLCQVSDRIDRLAPVWIPIEKIANEKPGDMDIQYPDSPNLSFRNIGSQWAQEWYIYSVRLFNGAVETRSLEVIYLESSKGPIYRFEL